MRLSSSALDAYAADLAELVERYGAQPHLGDDEAIELGETADGTVSFEMRASVVPGEDQVTMKLREHWRPERSEMYERVAYEYELIDRDRSYRRAFHRHDEESCRARYQVVVHEHCEHPLGNAPCDHVFGQPVKDGYAGIRRLLTIWTEPPDDCRGLPCLD